MQSWQRKFGRVLEPLLKKKTNKKKITIQIFDKATSVKTIYKQSPRTGIPSHVPAQPYVIIFWTNPSTVYAETASVVSPFQVSIVLGKKENFSPLHSDGDTERGGICYLQPQDRYLFLPIVTRLVCIL